MKKNKYQWYVVKYRSNKYNAVIFDNYKECLKFIKGKKRKGLTCKGFSSKEDAIQYAGCRESKILFRYKKKDELPSRICGVCEKNFKGKTKLCPTCNKRRQFSGAKLTVGMATTLKALYPDQDIFTLIESNPYILYSVFRSTSKEERKAIRKDRIDYIRSDEYKNTDFDRNSFVVPDYILQLMNRHPSKELLFIEGSKNNPIIYYRCKRCDQEHSQTYESLLHGHGHNCSALKSSGEAIVEDFLTKNKVKFKTQRNTLRCINPKTGMVMPYDIELADYKVIIEVQGSQHSIFSPYFHGTIENFEYQKWKDTYKRVFAEKKGYQVIYIDYHDITSGKYQKLLTPFTHADNQHLAQLSLF